MHATAETLQSTDWAQIHELYRMLLTVAPSPAAALGAAIALSELDGPAAGLEALRPLLTARPRDHRILAAVAHLLDALGSPEAADAHPRTALPQRQSPTGSKLTPGTPKAKRVPMPRRVKRGAADERAPATSSAGFGASGRV